MRGVPRVHHEPGRAAAVRRDRCRDPDGRRAPRTRSPTRTSPPWPRSATTRRTCSSGSTRRTAATSAARSTTLWPSVRRQGDSRRTSSTPCRPPPEVTGAIDVGRTPRHRGRCEADAGATRGGRRSRQHAADGRHTSGKRRPGPRRLEAAGRDPAARRAGAHRVRGVRAGADRPGGLLQPLQLERAAAARPSSSGSTTTATRCRDPVFLDALRAQLHHRRLSIAASSCRSGSGVALLLNRRIRGRGASPHAGLRPVRAGRGHRRRHLAADPAARRLRRPGRCESVGLGGLVQLWLADPDVVLWTMLFVLTWKYVGLRDHAVPRRPAEHPGRAERGGRDRRRALVADPAARSRSRCSARRSGSGSSCR